MRGKGLRLFVYSAFLRITPAYAGKSDIRTHFRRSTRDHPRVCGEKWIRRDEPLASEGSPPHMRGKGFRFLAVFLRFRITPAYAGKSPLIFCGICGSRDHPRICGEKKAPFWAGLSRTGSPPHMRGKVGREVHKTLSMGITPAYAGKRFRSGLLRSMLWDHPRICGEKDSRPVLLPFSRGSPPHMRGKAGQGGIDTEMGRITPAYAGKRTTMNKSQFTKRDHPRICGEKLAMLLLPVQFLGSPPHMRGKAHVPAGNRTSVGITPAYAGKSINISPQWNYCQDHPRICGEKTKKIP